MFPLLLFELQSRAADPQCQEPSYKESRNPKI
jgi:hypothetical protein